MADINDTINSLMKTQDVTSSFDPADVEQNKVMGILAYLGPLVLVPILGAKDSAFAKFHANQGLVLMIASLAIGLVFKILGSLPLIGVLFSLVGGLVSLGLAVLMILGIVYAAGGQAKELPVAGAIKLLK